MSAKSDSNIKYPYEYIAAQVEYGVKVVAITKLDPVHVFNRYTNLYGTLSNHHFATERGYAWVKKVLAKLNTYLSQDLSTEELSKKIYDLYLTVPLEKHAPNANKELHFGCFRLNNSKYYKSRKEVRLHFCPTRAGLRSRDPKLRASDLAPVYMDKRKAEFKRMIQYIHENPEEFGGATHFVSSSWLQNLSVYKSFFPANIRKKKVVHGHWWFWGQFLKWDLTGNEKRLNEFRKNLKKVRSLKSATNAIPLQIYEVRVPLKKMFAKHAVK
jgi:hypothetical protein